MIRAACAFERNYAKGAETLPEPDKVWSIAGNYEVSHGAALDPAESRLQPDGEDNDESDGIRIEYKGGPSRERGAPAQKMIMDLICPRDTKNSQGKNKDGDESKARATKLQERDDDGDKDEGGDDGDDDDNDKDRKEEKDRLELEK